MFHVEHAKNQKSAKKQILRIFLLFFLFKLFSKNRKKSLTFLNFWRGGASSRSTIILHGPQKRVTAKRGKVMVYFQQSSKKFVKIGAGAPVVVRR